MHAKLDVHGVTISSLGTVLSGLKCLGSVDKPEPSRIQPRRSIATNKKDVDINIFSIQLPAKLVQAHQLDLRRASDLFLIDIACLDITILELW